ncbi:MAG TPA: SGNH/GDSL hydrolase family protein [Syntrophorhabdus sp.]|jgi:hypothetical protein|nr:SGNH/GDSL hydrolase family protein [Syntrophorhabdus sp.]
MQIKTLDLSQYSDKGPGDPVHLLFIHHSCGGQLFADKGPEEGENCIYKTHPNGGGLRQLLEENNYIVHEASYGSLIGDKTDICHWNVKFRDHMDKILACRNQDEIFQDHTRNSVVMFKSCFPNSWIESEGRAPGDPDSCKKTMENYKAAYNALLEYFRQQPGTLFVAVTAPPLAKPVLYRKGKLIELAKTISGRPDTIEKVGPRARAFNNWLKDVEGGWLKGYELDNVVVFDYYDILTENGKSDWAKYPSRDGTDSHPSSEGNRKAAEAFAPLLNRAVHRIGL